jgi:N-acetyl sugar amidotransferase
MNVDWNERHQEFIELCAKHRNAVKSSHYDCIIPVSGGKDSTYQVKVMKEDMGMNPLLVNVSNFDWTDVGKANYENMLKTFDCECLSLDLSPETAKKMFRYSFEEYGSPTWYWDRAVYTYPLWVAKCFGIPLIVYGENVSYEYGGPFSEDTPSAALQVVNQVANSYADKDFDMAGVPKSRRFFMGLPPDVEGLEPVYLSYYLPWSGSRNRAVAEAYGFKGLSSWEYRDGYIEQYDQIDAVGYLVHCWMKYPKFGHARATDVASSWIREGIIDRSRAMELVKEHDHKLDGRVMHAFCDFCGYTIDEFWSIVHKHKADYVELKDTNRVYTGQGDQSTFTG